jgi:hypothetical protein
VRASAPAGCSPQDLGGMSYPFKGPPGEDEGSRQAVTIVTLVTLRVVVHEKVGGLCSVGYFSRPIASPWRGGM